MPAHPEAYAASLYAELHKADGEGWEWLAIEEPPQTPEWDAIRDRLKRAAVQR
jgi:L-threonylcarbamoyladenylate synthase